MGGVEGVREDDLLMMLEFVMVVVEFPFIPTYHGQYCASQDLCNGVT